MRTQAHIAVAVAALFLPERAPGQVTNVGPEAVESGAGAWSFSASAYGFLVPDSRDYVNPNFTADREWLHLEARYNYEALETGSLWLGYNFSIGKKLVFEAAPMLGGVFGELTGVAPGWNASLEYWRITLSSQGEYVFDVGDSDNDFFYTWSELSFWPTDWLQAGVAIQRTKAYETDLDIQRGLLVGFAYRNMDVTGYVFNLGWTDATFVLAVGYSF